MILEFLKGKLNSKRFNGSLDNIINDLRLDSSIIFNGNIKNKKENLDRLNIMKKFRGYPDNGLFENFPKISEWKYLELDEKDIDKIKAYSAASDNIGNFFGQNVFMASSGVLLISGTLESLGYNVDTLQIAKASLPIALAALVSERKNS